MATETCGVCGEAVPFSMTVHVVLHVEEGEVKDHFVCRDCYESEIEPLFE